MMDNKNYTNDGLILMLSARILFSWVTRHQDIGIATHLLGNANLLATMD